MASGESHIFDPWLPAGVGAEPTRKAGTAWKCQGLLFFPWQFGMTLGPQYIITGNTKYVLDGHWFMMVYGNWWKLLKTHSKRWDLPKLAIPLFKVKVMSLYFSNIHISDTQIGRWFLWIIYLKNVAVSCKRYPPSLPYAIYHYCTNVW